MGKDWTPRPAPSGKQATTVESGPLSPEKAGVWNGGAWQHGAWRQMEPHELPERIADLYAAYGWSATDPCAELLRTRANSRIFRVETADGNRILRVSPRLQEKRARALDHFRAWLREQGLPVLLPLAPQRDSGLLQDRPWIEVFPEIRDSEPEQRFGDGRLREAAALQARFHAVADRYPRAQALGEALAHQAHIQASLPASDWTAMGRDDVSPFGQALRWALQTLPTPASQGSASTATMRLGHFDWNPGNLLWGEGSLSGPWIIDFDFCGSGARVLDVALGMHRWARCAEVGLEETGRRMSLYRDAYARSWSAHAVPSRDEPPSLGDCLAALETQGLRNIAFILDKHYRCSDASSDGDLLRQFEMLHELRALS